jgi:GNAT superfamily N-acetyltransferase
MQPLVIEPLTPDRIDAWHALFDASNSACFCRYWHFEGDKNTWLARCAFSPDDNNHEQTALVTQGDACSRGLIAMRGNECVGWMKLTPRASVPKLRRLPVYRALDLGDDEGTWSIGCLLVRPDQRTRGVSNALISAAAEHARVGARVPSKRIRTCRTRPAKSPTNKCGEGCSAATRVRVSCRSQANSPTPCFDACS